MLERVSTLSPPLRYSIYFAAVLMVLFLAAGVGATAAAVVGWRSDRTETGTPDTGAAGNGAPGAGGPETTGVTGASEGTVTGPSGDSNNDSTYEESFVHRATEKNSRGDYTYISDPSINGDTRAVVLASPTPDRETGAGAPYGHTIGVWYESSAGEWAIFNQDRAPVPAGSTFEVIVPQPSSCFVHRADLLNTAGNYTYLDNPLTNGKPDAVLSVTQSWNPGGGRGVYNDHPVGTLYDAKVEKWAIYNRDGGSIPVEAAFNVSVSAGAN